MDFINDKKYSILIGLGIIIMFKKKLLPILRSSKQVQDKTMKDKVVIVTGANSGIGLETAIGLANRGAHVIMAGRREIVLDNKKLGISTEFEYLDLASLDSIKQFAQRVLSKHEKINILINNAGLNSLLSITMLIIDLNYYLPRCHELSPLEDN
jgi:NAD(P)-dependent dehydrogenase (short-subunit alcohol dehydrogenase family)